MTKKIVHVNEYVKDDGTYVREHYRGLPSNSENYIAENTDEAVKTLYGGISEDVQFEKQAAPEQAIQEAGWQIGEIIAKAILATADAPYASAEMPGQNNFEGSLTGFEPAINDTLLRLLEAQEEADKQEAETLKKLVTTKNQTEYKNLYRTYQQQKAQNKETKTAIAKIQHVVENQNKEISRLQQQQNLQNILINSGQMFPSPILYNPLMIPNYTLQKLYASKDEIKKDIENKLRYYKKEDPELQKSAISTGMNIFKHIKNCYDADELWKAAAYNFQQSAEYISKNGYSLNSTSALTPDLQRFVRKKVKEQLGVNDAKGIIFKPDSTLSQAIVSGTELKKFVRKNLQKLQNHEVVNGSATFNSSENLAYALGNADIYNAYIDSDGNFRAYVIDTYDFNKNDPRWAVEWAYNVQKNGLITNFYTVNTIVIPKEQLYEFIFN